MDKMSKISVLMPLYNAENYVKESVKSILDQTFKDFELIVIDDCSKDGSFQIVSDMSKTDSRLKIYRNETNLGVVSTRNKLIELSVGKYIAMLDSDDVAFPERLKTQYEFMENNQDIAVCGTNAVIINESGKKTGVWKHETDPEKLEIELFFHYPFVSSSLMIRKNSLPEKHYDPDYPVAEDYELVSRIALNFDLANINIPFVKYRLNCSGLSQNNRELMRLKSIEIIENYASYLGVELNKADAKNIRKINSEKRINPDLLAEIEKTLAALKVQLIRKKVFDEKKIGEVFQDKWFEACRKSAFNGMKVYRTFFNSELYSGQISFKKRVRLFARLLFRAE